MVAGQKKGREMEKKRGVFAKIRFWWKTRVGGSSKRKGLYGSMVDGAPLYDDCELMDTFSIDEDLGSQGLLLKSGSPVFDNRPLVSAETSTLRTISPELFPYSPSTKKPKVGKTKYATIGIAPESTFGRQTTHGSVESLDSLESPFLGLDEEESLATPRITNKSDASSTDATFGEHVKFLRIQTQPRNVEHVWKPSS